MDELRDELLDLERRGWDALSNGSGADFYGSLMTDDGVMVLAHGFALTREQVVASLNEADPWASYDLDDPRLVPLTADAAALVYTAVAQRDEGPTFRALMSSTYVREGDGWRLALYQQTPLPG